MKILSGFKLRPLGREFIITADSPSQVNFNKMIALNSTAAFLWNAVSGKDFTPEMMAELLEGEYEVDHETALRDSKAIAAKWIEVGIAEE